MSGSSASFLIGSLDFDAVLAYTGSDSVALLSIQFPRTEMSRSRAIFV